MTMVLSWEDALMHATTIMHAKINVWNSSKYANLIALARFDLCGINYVFDGV